MTDDPDKKTKQEVDYSRGSGDTICRNCTHYFHNASQCALVRGPIDPSWRCKLFNARRW